MTILPATRARLARMIGLDARDAEAADRLAFAQAWRSAQVSQLAGELQRVMATHRLGSGAVIVSAGCGGFLVTDVAAGTMARAGGSQPLRTPVSYGGQIARRAAEAAMDPAVLAAWAQVCAPCVAVATLLDRELR